MQLKTLYFKFKNEFFLSESTQNWTAEIKTPSSKKKQNVRHNINKL